MQFSYLREEQVWNDINLRTYQNLLENEAYTPYLDTFNVTGLLGGKFLLLWSSHPLTMRGF